MEEFLQFFQNYGFMGIVSGVLFIWIFVIQNYVKTIICRFQEDLKCINNKMIEIVESNTKAMIELRDTIREIKK